MTLFLYDRRNPTILTSISLVPVGLSGDLNSPRTPHFHNNPNKPNNPNNPDLSGCPCIRFENRKLLTLISLLTLITLMTLIH